LFHKQLTNMTSNFLVTSNAFDTFGEVLRVILLFISGRQINPISQNPKPVRYEK
jgi:hypothetical protein